MLPRTVGGNDQIPDSEFQLTVITLVGVIRAVLTKAALITLIDFKGFVKTVNQ